MNTLLSDFHNEDMKLKSTITKILVENGIDINVRDSHDGTALVYLVCNNSIKTEFIEIIKRLEDGK